MPSLSLLSALLPLLLLIVAWPSVRRSMADRALTRRVQSVLREPGDEPQAHSANVVVGKLSQLGSSVQQLSILSDKDVAELERAARAAGFSPETAVPLVIGGKLVLMIAGPLLAYVATKSMSMPWPLAFTCLGVGVGMLGPNLIIGNARKARQKSLRLGLSDALDLLVVCAEAGLGLESAINRVALEMQTSSPHVAEEFAILSQDLRLSSDRGAALLRLGERTGLESFQRLTSTLSQTLRYGTPLGQALRLLSAEMRNDRLLRLEEKAAKLPTLLTLPLAAFILPCLFIVVAGPAALRVTELMH